MFSYNRKKTPFSYRTSISYLKINALLLAILLIMYGCGNSEKSTTTDLTTVFERSEGTETATYKEVIDFYTQLADAHTSIAMYEMENTDNGEPLHMVTFNPDRTFESEFDNERNKTVILINNGIHPGESDGIDASMMLLRDYAKGTIKAPRNTIIAVIPVYNIGGALNRNSTSRTNQNGPEAYGFRGNARNYDLNRDFIKADTKNTRAFMDLFRTVQPDIFIDTHVSNGADYQYVLTHLFTQHNKLGGVLGTYLNTSLMPQLQDSLAQKKWDITPYVNVFNTVPEKGFSQFMDAPRYSTGYAALYNTLGLMVETHMLKPYKQRVEGTYELLKTMVAITDKDKEKIKELRKNASLAYKAGNHYPVQWEVDSSQVSTLQFKGFEGSMIPSTITGSQRLQYDREQPFTKEVAYYNHFKASESVTIPEGYIIPKGYWNILELLEINKIKMTSYQKDTVINATVYHIQDYNTTPSPYEGHYIHSNTSVTASTQAVKVSKGDVFVTTDQEGVRYLLETLEPTAVDSFFNWNFFDTILQQKEGFSPYVWEDKAALFLEENPDIQQQLEEKRKTDPAFAQNWYAQLDWIHKQSPHYEKAHLRYPIVRVGG